MPPLSGLRVAALADLLTQVRFAPREALKRMIDRVEDLALEVSADHLYAEDWLIHKITGYRPQLDEPATLVGAAVLADLSSLAERLCAAAKLRPDEAPEHSIGVDELASRWNVSRKTIDRYRRRGLIARRVTHGPGKASLLFSIKSVSAFEAANRTTLADAGSFTRMDDQTRALILRRAARYRATLGCSLNQAADRLARKLGRSHEAIRQVLRKHDAQSPTPIFSDSGAMTPRDAAFAARAAARFLEPADIARRLHRSTAAVRRAVNTHRLARLSTIDLAAPTEEWFSNPGADAQALTAPACENLGAPAPTDLLEFLSQARQAPAPIGAQERAQAIAMSYLRWRAANTLSSIDRANPEAGLLDRVETDLRWCARLAAELVRAQVGTVVRTMQVRVRRPLEEIRAVSVRDVLGRCLHAAATSVFEFDPFSGARLAARVALAVDRAAERWLREHEPTIPPRDGARALPRLLPGFRIADWTRRIAPWQTWLDLSERSVAALGAMSPESRSVITMRYGLAGAPPRTLEEVAQALSWSRAAAPRLERRALRELLAARRAPAA